MLAMVAVMASCKKEETAQPVQTASVTFYVGNHSNWELIVDDVDKGKLKYAQQMPVCGDQDYIVLQLSLGVHKVAAKSLDGLAWGYKNYTVTEGCSSYKIVQ